MNKIPAFTLLEITVSMLLSSIVILIGWSVFTLVSKSYIINQKKSKGQNQWLITKRSLRRDLDRASAIYSENNEVVMSNDSLKITYKKDAAFLLRTAGNKQTDTVFSGLEKLEIKELENDPYKRIDQLKLTLLIDSAGSLIEEFTKVYSSEELIKKPAYAND